ncbi:hypothetical protein DFH08DRAFT_973206 [Mycena albidolilacea]|uniref:Uncharacterized protein n=1 Tax=Mycena albidolilacea TaxID=1033008 RepID=A0AAD6Z9T0_9AGAR|nr:hypothetical protein DFH08DRAFT_973206 [Mycena albidolilacea]
MLHFYRRELLLTWTFIGLLLFYYFGLYSEFDDVLEVDLPPDDTMMEWDV